MTIFIAIDIWAAHTLSLQVRPHRGGCGTGFPFDRCRNTQCT